MKTVETNPTNAYGSNGSDEFSHRSFSDLKRMGSFVNNGLHVYKCLVRFSAGQAGTFQPAAKSRLRDKFM
ncbi:hypothetical protein [Paraburkholderia fynbosensis]|uniref:Uncharacterized protein n=1 Tax=Paraburkholderia fynbosensis TaxID=1200993 RepID=A0A6J5H0V8_9BURK|nr:hypothetical protein [Paraburkholderia fynbosensis]CAB3809697.1 hypothetical protein LMG27177_06878 [Paraburkholderia fynbosensis]